MNRQSTVLSYEPLKSDASNTHEDRTLHALDNIATYLCNIEQHLGKIANSAGQLAMFEGKRLSSGDNR